MEIIPVSQNVKLQEKTSFIVKELFENTYLPFGTPFGKALYNHVKDRTIHIPELLPSLIEYQVQKNMSYEAITKNSGFKGITLDQYWLIVYMLIDTPSMGDKDKEYMCYVELLDKTYTFSLLCWDNEWSVGIDILSFEFGKRVTKDGILLVSLEDVSS